MLKYSLIALAVLGTGPAGLSATAAEAMPVLNQQQPAEAASSSLMTQVQDRRGGDRGDRGDRGHYRRDRDNHRDGNWHYDRRRHGDRCGSWSRNCRHYHDGYWYENPWWALPMIGVGIGLGAGAFDDGYYGDPGPGYGGYGSRHVRWCMDRYRSYNVRSNTWVSYSGRVRQCVSPYGP